jgi:hypothetical protein
VVLVKHFNLTAHCQKILKYIPKKAGKEKAGEEKK